jgi:predicted DNA-binding protein (UPF0251 family)
VKPKGRPKKPRKIKSSPRISIFSPRGRPGRPDEVDLKYEELEALKLIDINNLKQIDAAKQMGISRQSFGRVLQKARRTISDALVNGKIIKVAGGCYKLVLEDNIVAENANDK